jgi:hypothetical protein
MQSPLHVGALLSAQAILPAVAGDAVSAGLAMVSRAARQRPITRRGHIDIVNPPVQTALLPLSAAASHLSNKKVTTQFDFSGWNTSRTAKGAKGRRQDCIGWLGVFPWRPWRKKA